MIAGLDVENKTIKCNICNKSVKNKYHRYDKYKKIYCNHCFTKSDKCFICKLPSSKTVLLESVRICMDCYSNKYHCGSCDSELESGSLGIIYGIQGFFCKRCIGLRYKCSRCGFPANDRAKKLLLVENSFYLCKDCQPCSILTEEVADNILMNVANILDKKMNLDIIEHLSIKLLTKTEIRYGINKMAMGKMITAKNDRKYELYPSFFSMNENKYTIYILKGLHISTFISVLTYEYVMLWQSKYFIHQISKILWEGIAEWIVTKVMILLGYHEEINKIESTLNQFAIGLKKIQVIERSKGVKGVVRLISQSK